MSRVESDASHLSRLKVLIIGARHRLDYAKVSGDAWLLKSVEKNVEWINNKINYYENK